MTTAAGRATTDEAIDLVALYRRMVTIREFDTVVPRLVQMGRIKGTAHSAVGQEAVAVGACAALRSTDSITSTHRGHGHAIAKGVGIGGMMAELFGRRTGICGGKGGSMHLADFSVGMLGANGVVGGGFGIATGAALARRLRGEDGVVVCFFGDSAINQGAFLENANYAALHALPVIYLCENNQFAMSMPAARATALDNLADRAAGIPMPGITVDGMDVLAVRDAVAEAVARARAGEGPTLIVADCYRFEGHHVRRHRGLPDAGRRLAVARARPDRCVPAPPRGIRGPDGGCGRRHRRGGRRRDPGRRRRGRTCAAARARRCLHRHLRLRPSGAEPRALTYAAALNEALRGEMTRDPSVFLLGEDIARWGTGGGVYGVTRGLVDEFGAERVRDTPVSEEAIVGLAVGAAMLGMRPVAEIMYSDFLTLAMDPIVNQAAKMRYMFGGQASVPLVVRTNSGAPGNKAAQHSQSLEAWFLHVPGLKVVTPATPADAKGLLTAAIRDPDPVIFLEHKRLYFTKGEVPAGEHVLPIGQAAIVREGRDLTVVANQTMVLRALEAADELAAEGIELEVIDVRTISPLDTATISASVRKTGRLIVAHEANRTGGWGAEVVARVAEADFHYLDAPLTRVAAKDTPIPFSEVLENAVLPGTAELVEAARRLVRS